MTQNIELLLKDIYARIPYGVKGCCEDETFSTTPLQWYAEHTLEYSVNYMVIKFGWRPYLFPLSSITIEQEKEISKLGVSYGEYALHDDIRGLGIMVDEAYIFFEFCYKHHIDFLGLIEKGLAIDATGLNIY